MTIIDINSPDLGGMKYPLLDGMTGHIRTSPIGMPKKQLKRVLGMTEDIVFRSVKDNKVVDLYLDGYHFPEQFLNDLGLEVSTEKGIFQMSKRWSRIFRPYYYWEMFDEADLKINISPAMDTKDHDGAMYIHGRILPKLCNHLPEAKRLALKRQLEDCGRVEVTVLGPFGELKGHALVRWDIESDIVCPMDAKTEVKMTNGQILIAVNPVHHADHMWLDFQSMINLVPFFDYRQLVSNMDEHGRMFLEAIKTGKLDEVFAHIRSMKELETWPVREFIARGGKAMHFASVVKALANQHLRLIRARGLEHMRAPLPSGGRYYVFSDAVTQRDVPDGHVMLDPTIASAIVSRKDWLWISLILGGADQDDALWCYCFTSSVDGQRYVMIWRSPNDLGEYVVLKPHGEIPFATWPLHNPELLPKRIDERQYTYLYEIEELPTDNQPYCIGACTPAILQATKNIGTLGQTVNTRMFKKVMTGDIGTEQSAPLEDVIDFTVKKLGNMQPIKEFNKAVVRAHIAQDNHVPQIMWPRIIGMLTEDMQESLEPTFNHWLDIYIAMVQKHIHDYKKLRDELALQAMPPIEVFEYGKHHLREAAMVKDAYAYVIRTALATHAPTNEDFEKARQASEAALGKFPVQEWPQIMAGVACRTYVMGDRFNEQHTDEELDKQLQVSSDACMWQLGKMNEKRPRPAQA
jgi:hypothetical protein